MTQGLKVSITPAYHFSFCYFFLPQRKVNYFLLSLPGILKILHLWIPNSEGLFEVIQFLTPRQNGNQTCVLFIQHELSTNLWAKHWEYKERNKTLFLVLRFHNPPHSITRCHCLMFLSSFPRHLMFSGDRISI